MAVWPASEWYIMRMAKTRGRSIEVHVSVDEFSVVYDFVTEVLQDSRLSDRIVKEVALVAETLFDSMLVQGYDKDTILKITERNRLGEVGLSFEFEGKRFSPQSDDEPINSPEAALLKAFDDRIEYSYNLGRNFIRISIRRGSAYVFLSNGVGILLAVVLYILMCLFMDEQTQQVIASDYIFPMGKLFANAALMVGAPVTLFSLLKHAADSFILERRYSNVRRLHTQILGTSIAAILLALCMGLLLSAVLSVYKGSFFGFINNGLEWSFEEIISPIVPSSILEPLVSISPVPLIVVALLCTYALCSVGKYFDVLKTAIDACYTLFARMLHAVMLALPFFSFLAILYILIGGGPKNLAIDFLVIVGVIVSLAVSILISVIRLYVAGVKLGPFFKGLPELIFENYKINSVIDAVPFNTRYCAKTYGMNRRILERDLPVLAQINRDGNCYLLTLVSLLVYFSGGGQPSVITIVLLGILVLFLSFGAPNQPGSILIGIIIISTYLSIRDVWVLAVFAEVLLGSLQNITNVVGDIIVVAIEDARTRKLEERG